MESQGHPVKVRSPQRHKHLKQQISQKQKYKMNIEDNQNFIPQPTSKRKLFAVGATIFLLLGAGIVFWVNRAQGYACVAVAGTVNWDSPSSWTGCNNSYPGSPANGNSDTVTIPDSAVVMTVNTSITVASISFTGGSSAASVSIADGVTLTVTGAVTINTPATAVTKELAVGSGSLIANGIAISGGAGVGRNAVVSASSGTITTTAGITFSGSAAQAQLNTTGAATINLTGTVSSTGTVSINSATTLVSTGASTINLASTWGAVSVPSGTLTLGGVNITFAGAVNITGALTTSSATGTVAFNSSVTVNSGGVLTFDGFSKGTTWAGDITHNGTTFITSTLNTAGATFGAGSYVISGSSDMTFAGSVIISGSVTNNNTGVVTVNGAISGTGSWIQGQNAYVKFNSSTTITTISASANANTVEYASGNQTCKVIQYWHLKFNGNTKTCALTSDVLGNVEMSGGSWTTSSAFNINGNLIVNGGTFVTGGFALTVSGTTTISSGSATINNNIGNKVFTGLVTLSGGSLSGASTGIKLLTGITNNGGTVAFSGTVTIDTPGIVFSGSNNIGFGTLTVTSPGIVTNNGTVTVSTTLNGTGSWIQGTGSFLSANGSSTNGITITAFDASSYENTVRYGGNSAQTCRVVQYYHLTFAGSLSKSCSLTDPILGNLIKEGSSSFSNGVAYTVNGNLIVAAGTFSMISEFTVNGTTTISGGTLAIGGTTSKTLIGMVTLDGGELSGSSSSTLNLATGITNNGGIVSFSGSARAAVSTSGVTFSGANTISLAQLVVTSPGAVTNNGTVSISTLSGTGSWAQGSNSTLGIWGVVSITNFNLTASGNTVNYSGIGAQTVYPTTYHHLGLGGSSSTKTMTGVTTVNGDLSSSGGVIATAPVVAIGGNLTISGTSNITLSGALLTVGGTLDIDSGATLTAPSGTLTIGNGFTRTGTFNHNNGTIAFNDSQQVSIISGNTSFNNFSVATPGKTVQFTSGESYTINGSLTLAGSSGNNVVFTSTTGSSTFNLTYLNTSTSVSYATVSWSACVGSYDINAYDGTNTDGGNNGSCWLFSAAAAVNISGAANGNDSATVKVAVNGAVSGVTTTITNNAWTLSGVNVPSGAIVVVWVDAVTDNLESTAVTKYDGTGDIAGMVLNTNTLSIGSGDNSTLIPSDFSVYDGDNDEDIMFKATASSMTAYGAGNTSVSLSILSGTALSVGTGGSSESIYVRNITINGDLVSGANGLIQVSGSWTNNGTFTAGTGSVIFAADAGNLTLLGTLSGNSGKFYNLTFDGTGGVWTAEDNLEVANNLMIFNAEFIAPSSLTVTGNFGNYGKFTSGSGAVTFNATDVGNLISGMLIGENKFNDLNLNGSNGEWNAPGDIEVNGDLQVSSGSFIGSGNLTVNGGTLAGNGTIMFSGNSSISNVESVAVGGLQSCAVTKLTDVYCWGYNGVGQLGINSTTNNVLPTRVHAGEATGADARGGFLTNIKYINAGYYHTCAISYSGYTYCWGQAQYGKLGDNQDVTNRLTPVKVRNGAATGSDSDGTYLINIKSMSMSYYHTCAVSNAGNAYCWGQGGKLGETVSTQRNTPIRVEDGVATGNDTDGTNLINVKQIEVGSTHTCALTYSEKVYCWGTATNGVLGNGATTPNQNTPVRVHDGEAAGEDTDGTYLVNINYLAADSSESCVISDLGYTYCWGYAGNGQLGDNQTSIARTTPVKVLAGAAVGNDTDGTYLINLRQIQVGDNHSCAVSNDGNAYCWGSTGHGALGDGLAHGSGTFAVPKRVLKGHAVDGDTDGTNLINIKEIALGMDANCALSNSQRVYCWGDRSSGLGSAPNSSSNPTPLAVNAQAVNFISTTTSYYDTCSITASTYLYCSGYNVYGHIGDGTETTRRTSVPVHAGEAAPADTDGTYLKNIKQVGTGSYNTCALSYAGNVYCWGYAGTSNLGNGQTIANTSTPIRVHDGEATGSDSDGTYLINIRQLVVGGTHVCAIANSGYTYCWGSAAAGRLGDAQTTSDRSTPVKVHDGEAAGSDSDGTYLINLKTISASVSHTCASSFSGNTYCWGTGGLLGNGSVSTSTTPVKVHDGAATGADSDGTYLINIKEISAGPAHSCAISYSGNTYCWGGSAQGQLGGGSTSTSNTPIKVVVGEATGIDSDGTYLVNMISLSAGGTHTCALAHSGYTYCWGSGSRIGVGNNSVNYSSPVKVHDGAATGNDTDGTYLINQVKVTTSFNSNTDGGRSCFVSLGGQLYCTGLVSSNDFGQFSDGADSIARTTVILGAKVLTPSLDTMNTSLNGTGSFGGSSDWKFVDLELGAGATGATTATGTGSITIYDSFINASGHTFNAGSKTITVGDDFTNSGTFAGNNSTVVFNNAGEVATVLGGVTNFNNLTITTPGKTVKFESGQMFAINGTLTIAGTANENVIIAATENTQWEVNHQGTEDVTYATISWSGCSTNPSSEYIDVSGGSNTNGGNNGTCWAFVPISNITFGPGNGPTESSAGSGSNSILGGNQSGGSGSTDGSGGNSGNSNTGNGQGGGGGGASPQVLLIT